MVNICYDEIQFMVENGTRTLHSAAVQNVVDEP